MHSTVVVIGVESDNHLETLLDRFINDGCDEYKEFSEAAETEDELRKEYEEKVFDQEYDQQYEPEKFGKKATEVFATLDKFVNYAHGYIRDPDDPVTGVFGEYYNPDIRMDWYSVGGRWSGCLVGRTPAGYQDSLIDCPYCKGSRVDPDHPIYICRVCGGHGQRSGYFEPEDNPDDRLTIAEVMQSGIRERRRTQAEKVWDFWETECSRLFPSLSLGTISAEQIQELQKEVNNKYWNIQGYVEEKIGVNGLLDFERGNSKSKEEFAMFNYNYFPSNDYVQRVDDHEEWTETENMWEVLEILPPETRIYLVDYHS